MKKLLLATSAVSLLAIGFAFAQSTTISLPVLSTVSTSDLFQDVPGGSPTAGNKYVTAAQIAGVPGYTKTIPLTSFSLTFANSQEYMLLQPAGTLAAGTITTAPNPSDGQRECIVSTQIVSALTLTANSGQTINGAVTALAANTGVCYTYSAFNATWDRS